MQLLFQTICILDHFTHFANPLYLMVEDTALIYIRDCPSHYGLPLKKEIIYLFEIEIE